MPVPSQPDPAELEFAKGVLRAEADAVAGMAQTLPPEFSRAVDVIVRCAESGGTVLVSGLGKSGLVGAKISATMASLGIASHPVHPTEAVHGDLGRFRASDAVIAISYSGETDELVALAGILRQDGLPIISITGGEIGASASHKPSSLERLAEVPLRIGRLVEAGGDDYVAPTSSTTAAMALGDALALAAARRRGFTKADFARRHPGGALGGQLRPVVEAMRFRVGSNLPVVSDSLSVLKALDEAGKVGRRPGALLLVGQDGRLSGILTDGDVRRLVLRDRAELDRPAREVMTKSPRTLVSTALIRDAANMIREFRQDEIPVIDETGKPVGILDVQDLVAMRLVQED